MAVRPILVIPDARLRAVADPIIEVDDEIKALAKDMLDTMYDAPGIGLAAPQIGVMKRIVVMDLAPEGEKPQPEQPTGRGERCHRPISYWAKFTTVKRPTRRASPAST